MGVAPSGGAAEAVSEGAAMNDRPSAVSSGTKYSSPMLKRRETITPGHSEGGVQAKKFGQELLTKIAVRVSLWSKKENLEHLVKVH